MLCSQRDLAAKIKVTDAIMTPGNFLKFIPWR